MGSRLVHLLSVKVSSPKKSVRFSIAFITLASASVNFKVELTFLHTLWVLLWTAKFFFCSPLGVWQGADSVVSSDIRVCEGMFAATPAASSFSGSTPAPGPLLEDVFP